MKKLNVVKLILSKNTPEIDIIHITDNDGLSPLHSLCGSSVNNNENDIEILKV
jgi:hypothetical protein